MTDNLPIVVTDGPEAKDSGRSGRRTPSWNEVRERVNLLVEKRRSLEGIDPVVEKEEVNQIRSDAHEVFGDYFKRIISTEVGRDILISIKPELSTEDLENVHGAYVEYLRVKEELEKNSAILEPGQKRDKEEAIRQNGDILREHGLIDGSERNLFVEKLDNIFTFELHTMDLPVEYEGNAERVDLEFLFRLSSNPAVEHFFGDQLVEQAVVRAIDEERFALIIPSLESQCNDVTRTNNPDYRAREGEPPDMNEQEALQQFRNFLLELSKQYPDERLVTDMLKNFSFLGKKEFELGCRYFADYYKDYLEKNEGAQLCLFTGISDTFSLADKGKLTIKSDLYVRELILKCFSNEDLIKYKGRLIFSLDDITVPPDKLRIVCPDDFIITGQQQRDHNYRNIARKLFAKAEQGLLRREQVEEYLQCIEFNTLLSSPTRIEKGLRIERDGRFIYVPVKSFFKAHKATESDMGSDDGEHDAYVTGIYTSPDYFNGMLDRLIRRTLLETYMAGGGTFSDLGEMMRYVWDQYPALLGFKAPYTTMTSLPEFERARALLSDSR